MSYEEHCKAKSDHYEALEKASTSAGAAYRNLYLSATYDKEQINPGTSTFAHMGWLDEDTYTLFPEMKNKKTVGKGY